MAAPVMPELDSSGIIESISDTFYGHIEKSIDYLKLEDDYKYCQEIGKAYLILANKMEELQQERPNDDWSDTLATVYNMFDENCTVEGN